MDNGINFLFFMTDHQRADSLGMVQCGREVTPNLNKLAAEGALFTRAYDTCPLCVPARTALATGLYPTKNGVVFNDWKGKTAGEWEPIHTTLKKAGYSVGHVGVDHIRVRPPMRAQELDYFINQADYEDWAVLQGIRTERSQAELTEVEEEIEGGYEKKQYSGHLVSRFDRPSEQFKDFYFIEHSLEFLRQSPREPFALFTYLWAPHPPLRVPEPYDHMYDPREVWLPDNVGIPAEGEPALRRRGVPAQLAEGVAMEEWKKVWAAHLGLVTMADDLFGRLVEELKRQGKWDKTCVVFTADHGDHLGQHRMYQKMEMYEEAVRVPLVIRMPGEHAVTCDEVVSHLDVTPTMCELAGITPGPCDGVSLGGIIRGKQKADPSRIVYSQYSGNPGYGTVRRAAISKRFKYVWDGRGEHELYDLELDPHEMKNVAADPSYGGALRKMHAACKTYHLKQQDTISWKRREKTI